MQSLLRPLRRRRRLYHHESCRTLVDVTSINWVRDRGLDHAVEKEKNLSPLLNLKNFIRSEPSKSLPLSIIAQNRERLGIPIRPIEFVRRYPSIFEEFIPGGIGINPHIKLTTEILGLDAEEQLIYHSVNLKQEVADRLLKLLMLARINKIPLHIIDRLKWDLGLPQDYVQTLVVEFPDYFQVTGGNGFDSSLELVCWSNDLAISVMEKNAMSGKACYEKGMPIAFPLQYSRGFKADKKFTKWLDGWQKLPYISPYENAFHLPANGEEADKWAVSVLHELLHLLIPKKTDKENVLYIGEHLGLRSRFKRALLHHPGIFYVSSKNRTHTIVLREGYKRNLLVENHLLMDMRFKYIHLMNKVNEVKAKALQSGSNEQKLAPNSMEGEVQDDRREDVQEAESYHLSDSEVEDDSDDEYNDNDGDGSDEDEDEDKSRMVTQVNNGGGRGRLGRKPNIEAKSHSRSANRLEHRNSANRLEHRNREQNEVGRSTVMAGRNKPHNKLGRNADESQTVTRVNEGGGRGRTGRKPNYEMKSPLTTANKLDRRYSIEPRNREPNKVSRSTVMRGRPKLHDRHGKNEDESRTLTKVDDGGGRGRTRRKTKYEAMSPLNAANKLDRRYPTKTRNIEPSEVPRSTMMHGMHKPLNRRGKSPEKMDISRNKGKPDLDVDASS